MFLTISKLLLEGKKITFSLFNCLISLGTFLFLFLSVTYLMEQRLLRGEPHLKFMR